MRYYDSLTNQSVSWCLDVRIATPTRNHHRKSRRPVPQARLRGDDHQADRHGRRLHHGRVYYYFADGKDHLLREVIQRSAREAELSLRFLQANSLEEFLVSLSVLLVHRLPQMAERFNWILLQFATLPDEEKRIFQDHLRGFQQTLRSQISHHVADEGTADRLAWLIFCAFFGYQQIFTTMEMGQMVDLGPADYGGFLAQRIGQSLSTTA